LRAQLKFHLQARLSRRLVDKLGTDLQAKGEEM
jgi:hypothetical protein